MEEFLVQITAYVGDFFSHQVAQWGIALAIAAKIHSGAVRKEIAVQTTHLVVAFENLGKALRDDLGKLSERVSTSEKRLDTLEDTKPGG